MTSRRPFSVLFSVLLTVGLLGVASPASAVATYVVNSTADDVDGGGCQTSPGDCTLREAITAANASPGLDKINFALGTGVPTIHVETALPAITGRINITGNTGGASRVELSGDGSNPWNGLTLSGLGSSQSLLRRLVVNGFGGVGIQILNSNDNNLSGNWIGTDETGLALAGAGGASFGILLQDASDNTVGALGDGPSNLISGNGVGVEIRNGGENEVIGNAIGTDINGVADLGNLQEGVSVFDSTLNDVIFNVISGNGGDGVLFRTGAAANQVGFNLIGLGVDGGPLPNGGNGVTALADTSGNLFGLNAIGHNGGLGIDLGDDGVTQNDNADADAGPNALQNFPVLTRAFTTDAGTTVVNGRLRSAPSTEFFIELMLSPTCDPSGFGEGERPVAQFQVTTDAAGRANFSRTIDFEVSPGSVVTGLATNQTTSSTSELSECEPVI